MLTAIRNFLYASAVAFDLPILEWIQAHLQSGLMDKIMPIITLFGEGGVFWIVLSLIFLMMPKTRKMGLGMIIAMLMGVLICNVLMKPIIARPRPYDLQLSEFGKEITLLIKAQHDYSFPSGHTIACFEASVVMLRNDKRLGIPAFILGVLVSFSRLYLYVHYPTDVLLSVVLGTAFAFIGDALAAKLAPKLVPHKKGRFEA